jgi:hypothetical protein
MCTASLQHLILLRVPVHTGPAKKKDAETHEPETCFRQRPKLCVGCMHRCLSHVNGYGLRELWCEDAMFLD